MGALRLTILIYSEDGQSTILPSREISTENKKVDIAASSSSSLTLFKWLKSGLGIQYNTRKGHI